VKRFVANRKGPWQKRLLYIGILSIMLLALLVFATCGDDDPEEIPDTATSVAVAPTPEAPGTTLRPRNEWTEDAPATRAEIEAELGKYRGKSISILDGGGAWQAAHRKAYYIPFQDQFGIEIIEDTASSIVGQIVLDGGGAWQAAHRNAYYIPFQEQFGIEIVEDTTSSIVGQIRGMSETGNITVDIGVWGIDVAMETGNITVDIGVWGIDVAIQLGRSGHAAELDYSVIDLRDHFPDLVEAGKPYIGGGGDIFSTVVAYSTESFPDSGPQPSTMADFFDLEEFPARPLGPRR
jgi:spermidine/putrescine-binding protein